jgi:DNA primase
LRYLAERRFNPNAIIEKYQLYSGKGIGRYRGRIVAPVFMGGRLVNFIARDVTGKAQAKYILEKNERAVVPREDLIYNLDNAAGHTVLILEGPTDVWRIGDGAVATFGTKFTSFQIQALIDAEVCDAFVLYDPEREAEKQAKRLTAQLSAVLDSAVRLEKQTPGDPGDMSLDEVIELRRIVWANSRQLK